MINLRKTARALCAILALGFLGSAPAEEALTGEQILQVEQALYSLGYHDDNFDALLDGHTREALRSFQIANGLEATGEVNADTIKRLSDGTAVTCHDYLTGLAAEYDSLPVLQTGSSGEAVSALQRRLKELGYFSGTSDGVFGDATLAAIRRFQMANGLSETGTADRATQFRLNEGEPIGWEDFLQSVQCVLGDSGRQVRLLQRTLRSLGYFQGDCTGSFGELTQLAVSQFQANNALEETGAADLGTCAALYSGAAEPLIDPQTLHMGDDAQSVADLQSGLAALGYFDRNITGVYGATTQTAVRLFQMANGLSATGEADARTLACLDAEDAAPLSSVSEWFLTELRGQDDSARAVVGAVAERMRGQSFEADDEDLYRGFAFVQYVCVAAGLPVVSPEDLMSLIAEPVEDVAALREGDILALRTGENGPVLLAVSSGGGRAVYALPDSGWVLESDLREMDYTELVRWNMTAAE